MPSPWPSAGHIGHSKELLQKTKRATEELALFNQMNHTVQSDDT